MTQQEQQESFQIIIDNMQQILLSKGHDYANDDKLSNFKLTAQIVGITPEQVALTLVVLKAVRLGNLLANNKTPNNESILDNTVDLTNYGVLMQMILDEVKQ